MARVFDIAFNLAANLGSSFSSTFGSASSQLRNLQTNASTLRTSMRELERAQRTGQISAAEYANQQRRLAEELARTERAQRNLSGAMRAQQNVSNFKDKAQGAMTTAAIGVAAFAVPIASAIQYDSAMTGVAKQVDGARDDAGNLTNVYYEMSQQIMQASKSMMIMPDVMAKSFTMAAKSGVKGAENIDRFARMGIMMGTAFEAPAEKITEDFAKIGSAIGINLETKEGIDKLEELANAVNYLDDQTNASGADIIDVLKRTAGTASSLLPTLSDKTLAGMATAMLQMGETSETTGTALNALFTKVAAAPTQGKPFQEALAQIGYSAEELQAGALQDAEGTMLNLFERIGQLDGASKNNVLAELFGAEYIGKLSKISGNYDQFVEIIKKGNSEAAKGSMAREFAIQSDTVARKLEGVKVAAAHSAISMGQILLPAVIEVTQKIMEISSRFAEWSVRNPELTSLIVKTAAGVAVLSLVVATTAFAFSSVILPLMTFGRWMFMARIATDGMVLSSRAHAMWSGICSLATSAWTRVQLIWNAAMGIGKILLSVGMMVGYAAWAGICATATAAWTGAQWLWNAALTANPIGLVIVGIAGLIAAGYLLITNWDTVKTWFSLLWNDPMAALSSFANGIMEKLSGPLQWLEEKWNGLKNLFAGGLDGGNIGAHDGNIATPDIASNAIGGIYNKGSFLTTFAEDGPEAAIPLDGSPRSMGLLAQVNQMMGFGTDQNNGEGEAVPRSMGLLAQVNQMMGFGTDQNNGEGGAVGLLSSFSNQQSSSNSGGGNMVQIDYKPANIYIYGNPEPGQVQSEVNKANSSFLDFLHNERRLSFNDG